ncbi:hypothetical protein AGR7C_Lc100073 [Agrobacterium deltaense Zutra 3/1]|uniref:Uncharacterized protein n=1 Tax=Agrobacterium deltaense Zutra 3/1 TaxID=1183427 RepID=A0A1S7QRW0_9HYPH|nr:hypothetical protein AGR7C_Lc100073 [Agrobacterium deltaense Zutra 3/1]
MPEISQYGTRVVNSLHLLVFGTGYDGNDGITHLYLDPAARIIRNLGRPHHVLLSQNGRLCHQELSSASLGGSIISIITSISSAAARSRWASGL